MIRPLALPLIALATSSATAATVEYNRDIRPILTRHCTACHGGVKEAGNISFIYRQKALGIGASGKQAISPGNPAASEMVRRIKSTDPDSVMPQPKHGPPLNASEIALIEKWIAQGANWQDHWAFVPPTEPTPPQKTTQPAWPSSTIDQLVLAKLDENQLQPAPEASPAEWLRRVSFDLTGLPPSPEELATFTQDVASDPAAARSRTVDRLLASPHYGERWAAVWLDIARYSDTYGFEKDPGRTIWPWRDWVIRAFNSDLPFDRFTIEQLAGDLLPNPTADQRLATAFHRNTQNNTEGGTDDEEYRLAAVIDRTNTTWTAWQATTFGCVQCHAHPYDPIRHEEYYQFMAYYDNSEDCDLDDDFPTMRVANDPEKRNELSQLEAASRQLRAELNEPGRTLALNTSDWSPFAPDQFAPSHGKLTLGSDHLIRTEGTLPIGCTHKFSGPASPLTAARLRILPDHDDPRKWPERGSVASAIELNLIDPAGTTTPVKLKEVFADHLAGPLDPAGAIRGGGGAGSFPKLSGPRWFVLVPEAPLNPPPGSRLEWIIKQNAATTGNQATPLRTFAIDLSQSPAWTTLAADPKRTESWQQLASLNQQLNAIPATRVPVMIERPSLATRETRVFARGNRLTKENPVTPAIPEILNPNKSTVPSRLEMAQWLVSPENPLTARVLANRLWGELFGTGLVETMEDFGTSGATPSHPELLDHLALRLQNHHHWSIKAFLKDIVLSSTYRQSSKTSPELATKDPRNRLLARGPRNRLSAEMIRDQALATAGLLSPKMFGPPVFPPQPQGVWNSVYSGATWNESQGEDRLRRGIYTYSKRTSGFPGFLTFDAPNRDLCTPRRITTNTPLQALITLNDPAHIEAAKALAQRMALHSPDLQKQLTFGLLLTTQQIASDKIQTELTSLYEDALNEYTQHPEQAKHLGESPAAAALTLTANTLLNLDAALTR